MFFGEPGVLNDFARFLTDLVGIDAHKFTVMWRKFDVDSDKFAVMWRKLPDDDGGAGLAAD